MAETSQPAKQKANEFPFSVSVGTVYDGPLDLLLGLVRKRGMDRLKI
jgi:segregation and condensation protein A